MVSTSNARVSEPMLLTASTATISRECKPSARGVATVNEGAEHGTNEPASILHKVVVAVPPVLTEKEKVGVLSAVVFGLIGGPAIVTTGGVVSTSNPRLAD